MGSLKSSAPLPGGLVAYRGFRLSKLNTPEFSHLLLLLFWPVYGLVFYTLERGITTNYHVVHAPLDDRIPFCELFLIPYLFWFVFLVGMLAYLLFFDVEGFRKFMYFVILTYTATCVIYIVWPSMQNLRPETFQRDNALTRFMADFYAFDTNTNVCPSLHVIGSFAAMFGGWHTKRFSSPAWRATLAVITLLISISTVFLKQHSVLDIPPALLLSLIAYILVYRTKLFCKKKSAPSQAA